MITVYLDAKEVLSAFDQLELRKQENVLRQAYYKGASIIRRGAQYGMIGYFKGGHNSAKVYSMVKSISYKYNKRGQFVSIYPTDAEYYGYMARWFIAGTGNRWSYTRESRRRKSGKMTMRKYKTKKKHYFGALPGNNVIETAYNAYRDKANEAIKDELENKLLKIWNKNGR